MRYSYYLLITGFLLFIACKSKSDFPAELVQFTSYPQNPVFKGTASPSDWDEIIRERGYIIKEDDTYHLWYTGYKDTTGAVMSLGYATSPDGLIWTRYAGNPIYDSLHTEDMMIIKEDDTYQMFAEGKGDIAHRLVSTNRIHWQDLGSLDIRLVSGDPISAGPYGTPSVIKEGSTWYLFYERNDDAIWLASSKDLQVWTNVQDEPILLKGPESYDRFGVAMNQVIKYHDKYYGYYHGTPDQDWSTWNTNVAVSEDLIHWTKYSQNPILQENKSSGILVHDGAQYRMYTMHPEVCVHFFKDGVR